MPAVKIVATVGPGGTVTVDHLPFAAGEQVEVTVSPTAAPSPADPPAPWPDPNDPTEGGKYPLRGTPGYYIDPFEPACPPEDWEALQ